MAATKAANKKGYRYYNRQEKRVATMISHGLFSSRITKPRILCESQVRMGGKARQEMRGGECKGGRTNERAEPLNIHVHR